MFGELGEFVYDDCVVFWVVICVFGVEVVEFVDVCEWYVCIWVVYYVCVLEVVDVEDFFFEIDGLLVQFVFGVVEVLVYGVGVDDGDLFDDCCVVQWLCFVEEVG